MGHENPEVEAPFMLVVPPFGAEVFESLYFGLDVVCLDAEVHALPLDLGIVGELEAGF